MKKIILSLAVLVGLGTLNAQNIKFGAKAGLNVSNVRFDSKQQEKFDEEAKKMEEEGGSQSKDARIGFHVGAIAELQINEAFSVQGEVVYSTQGTAMNSKYKDAKGDMTGKWAINIDYLNVPLLVKYTISGVSLEVGPQFGFLLSGKGYEYENGELKKFKNYDDKGKVISEQDYEDFTEGDDKFSSFDLGLAIGASYKINNIYAGVRYNLGFSDLRDKRKEHEKDQFLKNGVLQVSVGYFF